MWLREGTQRCVMCRGVWHIIALRADAMSCDGVDAAARRRAQVRDGKGKDTADAALAEAIFRKSQTIRKGFGSAEAFQKAFVAIQVRSDAGDHI